MINVFVSYSHDSPAHIARVLALTERLRSDGFNAWLDQYEIAPSEGWPAWMEGQIERADFVVVIVTETYARRMNRVERAGVGLGAAWEGAILRQYLYEAQARNERFVPVVFTDEDQRHIPLVLRASTRFNLSDPDGYAALVRRLLRQPTVSPPPIGGRSTLSEVRWRPSERSAGHEYWSSYHELTLVPEGLRFEVDYQERTVKPKSVPELLTYWYWPVKTIRKDYRFGHLILLLREVQDVGMLCGMLTCDIDEFLDAAGPLSENDLGRPSVGPDHEAIQFLRVGTGILLADGERNLNRQGDALPLYHISRDFSGWGSWRESPSATAASEGDPSEGKIGLSILSMPEISHLELRLDDELWIEPLDSWGPERGLSLPAGMELTFGDLLQTIFWELSWFGGREEMAEMPSA